MKNKIIDIVCVCLVGAVFGTVVILNLFQPNRPVESLTEQRSLAKMPEFTLSSLADGSYFAGVSAFVSDTFLYRDDLVMAAKEMDTLRGFDYQLEGDGSFVLLDASAGVQNSEGSDELSGKLAQALENLGGEESAKQPDETEETASSVVSGEIVDDTADTDETEPPVTDETNETNEPGMIITPDDTDETAESDETEDAVAETDETDETDEPIEGDETDAENNAPNVITGINLSRESLRLTIGSGAVVYATVDSTTNEGASVSWSVSDKSVASISINPSGGIDVKGVAPGTCILTCSYNDEIKKTCEITVTEIVTTTPTENLEADFITGGMFIYGDAVYTQGFYVESVAKSYAQTALYYKQLFGENTNVSIVIAPVSSMCVDNEEVKSKVADQGDILDKMAQWVDPSINFVDTYSEMYDHRNEYLFFKSDHHWTQRGAYYAYRAFAESIGLEPTALDDFDYEIRNDSYSGSLYNLTHDERVKSFVDTIEVFNSRKPHTMTITTANGGTINTDNSIVKSHNTYLTYISGDNPYTVINVPENPQDKNVLVLKDSFGNAFVPFLCEHFGNIIVVDVRHTTMNVYEQLKDYGLTDIVFVNNIQAANSTSWPTMYLSAVGVK